MAKNDSISFLTNEESHEPIALPSITYIRGLIFIFS